MIPQKEVTMQKWVYFVLALICGFLSFVCGGERENGAIGAGIGMGLVSATCFLLFPVEIDL